MYRKVEAYYQVDFSVLFKPGCEPVQSVLRNFRGDDVRLNLCLIRDLTGGFLYKIQGKWSYIDIRVGTNGNGSRIVVNVIVGVRIRNRQYGADVIVSAFQVAGQALLLSGSNRMRPGQAGHGVVQRRVKYHPQ